MNQCFYFSQLQNFFDQLLGPLKCVGLTTAEGDTLFVQPQSLADVGTLSSAAEIGHKYLQLNDGDIVISNDPYSGGSILSSFTLVMGLSSQATRKTRTHSPADLLVSYRVPLKPKIRLTDKLDEEGLRVPPSPLYQASRAPIDRKNQGLIDAIKAHPQCPHNFEEIMESSIKLLLERREKFQFLSEDLGLDWSRGLIRKYLRTSNRCLLRLLGRLRNGEATVEHEVAPGEKIRLRLEIKDDKVTFDFTGTGSSKHIHLTDAATYGACVGAFLAIFDQSIPLNDGVFSSFEIVAPAGSVVNALYPAPVFQGMTDGTALIANMILKATGIVDVDRTMAATGISQCAFELEFATGKYFYETLPAGSPASLAQSGQDGVSLWTRTSLEPRLELIESLYPITLNSYSFRANSGGDGEHPGGDGVTKSLTTQSLAKLRWMITPGQTPEGAKGGKTASDAEIYVQKASGREKLAERGEAELEPGDMVIVHSSGGGGFGEKKKS